MSFSLSGLSDTARKRNLKPYLYVLPALAVYAVFMLYPLYKAFLMSFHRFKTFTGPNEFVGLSNYRSVLTDPLFWESFKHTLVFSLGLVFIPLVVGLGLAMLLDRKLTGSTLFQSIIFSPLLIPVVVAGLLFTWLFNTRGILNYVLVTLGVVNDPISWLSSQYAMLTIVIMTVWKRTGYYMIILFAGLQGIPDEMYEVARIQGKSRWQTFRHITLPLLKPALLVVVVVGIIDSIKLFAHVWVMTEGGPAHNSEILSTYFYKYTFQYFQFGRGAAIGFILLLISLVLSSIIVRRAGYI